MINNLDEIIKIIMSDFEKQKILIVGDIMLDKYYYGEVQRISPEAPVPIMNVKKEKHVLGGAANVANNLTNLGCKVLLSGITGEDENRKYLCNLIDEQAIDHTGVFFDERPTITKTRIIGLHQQMIRLDFEEIIPISSAIEEKVISNFDKVINNGINVVIISDYGKGVCTDRVCRYIIDKCNEIRKVVIIDPKGSNWDKYRGADYITPNIKELGDVVGDQIKNEDKLIESYAKLIKEKYNIKNLLVTRSEKGMSFINYESVTHIATEAKEVFDVSGAGDTVVATLAAFLSSGVDALSSVKLANIAAGIVISKMGTYPIISEEFIESINEKYSDLEFDSKIIAFDQVHNLVNELRKYNKKIVFTNGCFDILHIGHVNYLEKAKALGDILIVGLNSDSSVTRLKGKGRPINNEYDRANMLSALGFINYVVIFEEDTPAELINIIKPDVLVKGGDYNAEDVVGKENSGRVEIIPFVNGYSTTNIINTIRDKN